MTEDRTRVTPVADPGPCCAPLAVGPLDEAGSTQLAAVLGAMADPVRLRLLSIIAASGEVCSCNLEAPLGKSQPTISHHTSVLAAAGLIVGHKRGRWTSWEVVPERLAMVRRFLGGP
ncbi:MAG: metalloregulator ArsR/SmtB family transcription factor [Acidimicrobiales bacterium]